MMKSGEASLVLMQRHVCFHQAIIELSRQLPDGFCMQKQTEVTEFISPFNLKRLLGRSMVVFYNCVQSFAFYKASFVSF